MRAVLDRSPDMVRWAEARISELHGQGFPDGASAIGIEDSEGRILGVVVFHSYEPWNRTIEVSAVSEDPRWMRARGAWDAMHRYAFELCGVDKIWSRTPARNVRALRFLKALGFRPEAILRRQFGDDDAVISCKFREDWQQ
jgi:RimJ/RimL family protein N-acetyltransferase